MLTGRPVPCPAGRAAAAEWRPTLRRGEAGRTQTREGARCRRLARRIGKDKAQVAVSATQLGVCHTLLSSPGTRYHDLGVGYYDKRAQDRRKIRYHLAELGALGYDVTLTPRPGPDDDSAGTGQATAA